MANGFDVEAGAPQAQSNGLGDRLGQLSDLPPQGIAGGVGPSDIGAGAVGGVGGIPSVQAPASAVGPGAGGGQAPPGGPGPDTPIEQQVLQEITQAAQVFRGAADKEPSIRFIVDGLLQKLFADITKHYGMEEEGKLAIQQAQLQKRNSDAAGRAGPPGPPGSAGLV